MAEEAAMRVLSVLIAGVCALAVLGAGCGGGEEDDGTVVAVAFRLDEGSPVLSGYAGDPAEEPFEPSPGRYYVEAVDEDDMLASLGVVEIEAGDAVEFPPSFEAAGGTSDAEGVASLMTIVDLLVDVDEEEHEFLKVVTGGFQESPFAPAVELDDGVFDDLLDMYRESTAKEDAVLDALSEIEGRAERSPAVMYVGPPSSPPAGRFENVTRDYRQLLQKKIDAIDSDGSTKAIYAFAALVFSKGAFESAVHRATLGAEPLAQENEWQEYAEELVDLDLSESDAQKKLHERIKKDYMERFPDLDDEMGDKFATLFVADVMAAVNGTAAPTPTPTVTPATGWIDGYVDGVAQEWLDKGYKGMEVAINADHLRLCLVQKVESGMDQEAAIAACPASGYERGSPTPTPTPDATDAPTPTETEAPATQGQQVTVKGLYVENYPWDYTGTPEWAEQANPVILWNEMTLTFHPDGGPVDGDAQFGVERNPPSRECAGWREKWSVVAHYEGTYDPVLKQFSGTREARNDYVGYDTKPADDPRDPFICYQMEPRVDYWTHGWIAWLEDDGSVRGWDEGGNTFELTVQE